MSCKHIDGKGDFLVVEMDIECWEGDHKVYAICVGVLIIVIWIIIAPMVVVFYLMTRVKKKLNLLINRVRFGFLYNGFYKRTFYWEFVIFYRKVSVIGLIIFFNNLAIAVQALLALLLIMIFLRLQMVFNPYNHVSLNKVETRGILVAAITIYCGLYYISDDLDEEEGFSVFIVMVIANIYFLIYWLYHLLNQAIRMLIEAIPFLALRFTI